MAEQKEAAQSLKKPIWKKWWLWVLAVIALFIIIAASGDSSPQRVGEDGVPETNTEEETVFKIGDQIKIEDTILTVTDVNRNWKSSNEFDTPLNPNDVYVAVTIALENQGDEQISLSGFWDFEIQDANGVIRNSSFGGVGLNTLSTGSLAPGGRTSGDILFEVAQDATSDLTLHYQPLFSFRDTVLIELQ